MPELPEVEIVRRGLSAATSDRVIAGVELFEPHAARTLRRNVIAPAEFCAALIGRRIADVKRRGKYLWAALPIDGDPAAGAPRCADALLAHLGMSGQFRVTPRHDPPHRHTRVRLVFSDDGPAIDFLDQRTFGSLTFVQDVADVPGPIAHIATDPLDPSFKVSALARSISAKRTTIKRALLDQSVVSGIGNIYADEALHIAGVHYEHPTSLLPLTDITAVLQSAAVVMRRALAQGGTSFDELYVHVNGESGYFERSLLVYGRDGEPCNQCGGVIQREKWTNRSSYLCPRCQPCWQGADVT